MTWGHSCLDLLGQPRKAGIWECWQVKQFVGRVRNEDAEEDSSQDLNPGAAAVGVRTTQSGG